MLKYLITMLFSVGKLIVNSALYADGEAYVVETSCNHLLINTAT